MLYYEEKDMRKGIKTEMNKQENESLIQELEKRLEWYTMEASDEEFDAEQVQTIMKLLDSLQPEEKEKIEEELPEEQAVSDFWKYYAERENEERILSGREERIEKDTTLKKYGRDEHRTVSIFQKHRGAIVAAVVLAAVILGGSWQAVANAEKHGGFFWWMDKSEEGTTMITSPEGDSDFDNEEVEIYYDISEVPEEYKKYIDQVCEVTSASEYKYDYSRIVKDTYKEKMHISMKGNNDALFFEIIIYPQKILRARETYSNYVYDSEMKNEGISFDILSKDETTGEKTYLIYFYYGKAQYIIAGEKDKELLQNMAIEYKNAIIASDCLK